LSDLKLPIDNRAYLTYNVSIGVKEMGTLGLMSMIEEATVEQALLWHLQSNCYPAPHPDFYPVIKQAIELAKEGEWDTVLVLPNLIRKSVYDIVEQLRLEQFCFEIQNEE
jgi:hypothetical protein